LGKPYYLKIWLFEPELSKSQVVCAVGSYADFYDNTFSKPEIEKGFEDSAYYKTIEGLHAFNWQHYVNTDTGGVVWVGGM
jgi:hypothetical protein